MVRCSLFPVAVAALCFALVYADQAEEESKQLVQKCLQETGNTPDDVKAFVNGQSHPESVKCMSRCTMQGQNAMSADGIINVDAIATFAGEQRRAMADQCKGEATSAELCEKAYQFHSCFLAADPEYFKSAVNRLMP